MTSPRFFVLCDRINHFETHLTISSKGESFKVPRGLGSQFSYSVIIWKKAKWKCKVRILDNFSSVRLLMYRDSKPACDICKWPWNLNWRKMKVRRRHFNSNFAYEKKLTWINILNFQRFSVPFSGRIRYVCQLSYII